MKKKVMLLLELMDILLSYRETMLPHWKVFLSMKYGIEAAEAS